MLLTANRQEEILSRAKNRTVTAFIQMAIPTNHLPDDPKKLGIIVEDKKPFYSLTAAYSNAQGSHVWQQDDTCDTLAEKNPRVLFEILEALRHRMKGIDGGMLQSLHGDDKRVIFNSEDLVHKATGIPTRLNVKFEDSAEKVKAGILSLPFKGLQSFLLHLDDKLQNFGGRLHSADITHQSSMSAFDYYEISLQKAGIGRKFTYGDVMLTNAYNLLKDIGIPLVQRDKKGMMLN